MVLMLLVVMSEVADAGILAQATCYSACNAGVVACYAAAGLTFGVVAAGPAAAACNAAQGACMAGCTALLFAPTP
jgi:hypothetical protein